MINYFNLILDQNDEKVLNSKIASLPELPKEAKDYALILKKGNESVRKYPLNTMENLAFSYASFEKNRDKLTPEMDKIASTNLAKALDFYRVKHTLTKEATVNGNTYTIKPKDEQIYIEPEKTAFAIEIDTLQRLPIDTPNDLKDSIKLFKRDIYKLPVEIKKIASKNFVKRAAELGVEVPSELNKYASETLIGATDMRTMLSSRLKAYPDNIKKIAVEMLDHVKTAENAVEYIKFIETVDSNLNLNKVNHPDLSAEFFSTINKTADFYEALQEGIDSNVLNDYLDKEIIGVLKETPANFEHLNPNLKQTIKKILNVE